MTTYTRYKHHKLHPQKLISTTKSEPFLTPPTGWATRSPISSIFSGDHIECAHTWRLSCPHHYLAVVCLVYPKTSALRHLVAGRLEQGKRYEVLVYGVHSKNARTEARWERHGSPWEETGASGLQLDYIVPYSYDYLPWVESNPYAAKRFTTEEEAKSHLIQVMEQLSVEHQPDE